MPEQEVNFASIPEMQTFKCPSGFIQKPGTKGCPGGTFTYCIGADVGPSKVRGGRRLQEIHDLISVPKGTKDFRIEVFSKDKTLDMLVVDHEPGTYLLHPKRGKLHGTTFVLDDNHNAMMVPAKLKIVYKKMAAKYSGDDTSSPVVEFFAVEGTTTTVLDVKVRSQGVDKDAFVKVTYTNHGASQCDADLTAKTACIPLAGTTAPTPGPTMAPASPPGPAANSSKPPLASPSNTPPANSPKTPAKTPAKQLAKPPAKPPAQEQEDKEYVLKESGGSERCNPKEPEGLLSSTRVQSLVKCQQKCTATDGCSYVSFDTEEKICVVTSVCQDKLKEEGHKIEIYHREAHGGSSSSSSSSKSSSTSSSMNTAYAKFVLKDGKAEAKGGKEAQGGKGTEGSEEEGPCDAPKSDLFFAGPSEGEEDCEQKCTAASGCMFVSVSDKKWCVLTSTCKRKRDASKHGIYTTFIREVTIGGGLRHLVLIIFLLFLLLCCCNLLIALFCCKKTSAYKPVNYEDITQEIEHEMGGTPVQFKDHDYHFKPEGDQTVKKIAKVLLRHSPDEVCVKILGYTGKPAGKWSTHELCEKLGYKRALRIMEKLESLGCKHKIVPIGYGNVVGKGPVCEIHACTAAEAEDIENQALDKGQDPDIMIP